jgi:hypothetical protein
MHRVKKPPPAKSGAANQWQSQSSSEQLETPFQQHVTDTSWKEDLIYDTLSRMPLLE